MYYVESIHNTLQSTRSTLICILLSGSTRIFIPTSNAVFGEGRTKFFMYAYFLCILQQSKILDRVCSYPYHMYPHIICIYFTANFFTYSYLFHSFLSAVDLFPGYTSQLLLDQSSSWSLRFSNRCCYPRTGTLQT